MKQKQNFKEMDIDSVEAYIIFCNPTEEEEVRGKINGGTYKYVVEMQSGSGFNRERYEAPKYTDFVNERIVSYRHVSFMELPVEVQNFIKHADLVADEEVHYTGKGELIRKQTYRRRVAPLQYK